MEISSRPSAGIHSQSCGKEGRLLRILRGCFKVSRLHVLAPPNQEAGVETAIVWSEGQWTKPGLLRADLGLGMCS